MSSNKQFGNFDLSVRLVKFQSPTVTAISSLGMSIQQYGKYYRLIYRVWTSTAISNSYSRGRQEGFVALGTLENKP
jgi:hypothetical protein